MIDTHCHLFHEYYEDIEQVIKNMDNNIMIVSGVDYNTSMEALELSSKYNNIYSSIGIHPEEIRENIYYDFIRDNIDNIVAIGEIGLDYHFCSDNKEVQKKVFLEQLIIAREYKKPVIVHSRDAISDTYDVLVESGIDFSKVVIHCFSSSYEEALRFTKKGAKIGIGGVVTFKNSSKLKGVVSKIDTKSILLETDSPYLTPVPFRGERNEPRNVYYVAEEVARLKDMSLEDVLKITSENACNMFDLDV